MQTVNFKQTTLKASLGIMEALERKQVSFVFANNMGLDEKIGLEIGDFVTEHKGNVSIRYYRGCKESKSLRAIIRLKKEKDGINIHFSPCEDKPRHNFSSEYIPEYDLPEKNWLTLQGRGNMAFLPI